MTAPNGLTAAYYTVYGRYPRKPIQGRITPGKPWRGLTVDINLDERWLEELNAIPQIDIVSVEEGESTERPAHIIFYFADPKNDPQAQELSDHLARNPSIFSICDIGNRNRSRIVVASPVRSLSVHWIVWWSTVDRKIHKALSDLNIT